MPILLGSVIRHLLTLVAGSFLAVGVSEADAHSFAHAAEPVVSGAILYGASQAWSLFEKRKR